MNRCRVRFIAVVCCLSLVSCRHAAPKSPVDAAPRAPTVAPSSQTAPSPTTGPLPVPSGPLGDVDQLFLDSYTARRVAVLASAPPFVVVSGSSLILHIAGKKETVRVIPDIYHALKDIAHLPFAIYLQLLPVTQTGSGLTSAQASQLRTFLAKIDAARQVLSTGGYTPVELKRQIQIIDASQAIISATLRNNGVDSTTLTAFVRQMGPLMLLNAGEAGCSQIQATHAQMMKWKDSMSGADWNRLMIVNRARHQARYRNAATQYFHWLVREDGAPWSYPGESMRVIYAESLGPKEEAGDELATILIDRDASSAFFQDSWRLSEDILSDGAADCIKKLPDSDRFHL